MTPLTPAALAAPFGDYSHGTRAGGLIVTSGQLGLAADGTIPEDTAAQAEICFANIHAILRAGGAEIADVLRFTGYVTRREDMAAYMAVRDRWVRDLAVKPASTLLIVSGFTRPEFRVEVEALALVPEPPA
ncbi:MAG: RidA family protein [Rhodobacteraceae bacterium]|nr:MAG: RidA family protein [Paracoccaceae bacterium]